MYREEIDTDSFFKNCLNLNNQPILKWEKGLSSTFPESAYIYHNIRT